MEQKPLLTEEEKRQLKEDLLKECREKVAAGNGKNLVFWALYQYKEMLEILVTDPDYILDSLRSPFSFTEEDKKNMIRVEDYMEEYDKNGKVATPLYLKWKRQREHSGTTIGEQTDDNV